MQLSAKGGPCPRCRYSTQNMKQMARSGEGGRRTRQEHRQCSVVLVDVYQLF